MINRIKRPDKITIFFLAMILFDVLTFLMAKKHYYFSLLLSTGILIPALLTILSIFLLARKLKMKTYVIVVVSILVLPIVVLNLALRALALDYSYDIVRYPNGPERLTLEHRNATLGETHHFYNFYKPTAILGVSEKMNGELIEIVTRGTNDGDLEVLGAYNTEWAKNNNKVVFRSPYADTSVDIEENKIFVSKTDN
ncbi:hypothetical protein [Priestia aryabhattai]